MAGFTLVELISVLAIVAILGFVVFSGIRSVQKKSQQASAMSNLRSLGTASLVYTAEKRGDIAPVYSTQYNPPPGSSSSYIRWIQYLPYFYGDRNMSITYTRGDDLVQVAAPSLIRRFPPDPRVGNMEVFWSYARNVDLPKRASDASWVDSPAKMNLLPNPSRTMLFIEIKQSPQVYGDHPVDYFNFSDSGPGGDTAATFCDGHVERVTRSQIIAPRASWNAYQKLFWYGYPDAVKRMDY